MLLRLWHQIALLRLRPVALIMTQNVDSFEEGRSVDDYQFRPAKQILGANDRGGADTPGEHTNAWIRSPLGPGRARRVFLEGLPRQSIFWFFRQSGLVAQTQLQ